jgi:hypothetical protein
VVITGRHGKDGARVGEDVNDDEFTRDERIIITDFSTNKRKRNIRKRYCFPTLKSFSYYYNNRYYHQNQNEKTKLLCKYLSETDLTSLANQLSSYDKDLTYNVYHLDTLYNNVDYILFNSYASDTELVYNYNRRHGKNQHFLNSNYKLYINDYFNQPYGDDDEEEEDGEEDVEEDNKKYNVNDSQIQLRNEFLFSKEFLCDGTILADYELSEVMIDYDDNDDEEDEYGDDNNHNRIESRDFNEDCVDVYDFNDYQYGKRHNIEKSQARTF